MPQVTVYSPPQCPQFIQAKQFLEAQGIAFVWHDVGADKAKADEMVEKSGWRGVPVLEINGIILGGFDRDAVKRALKLA